MNSFQEKISAVILARIRSREASPTPGEKGQQPSALKVTPAKLREATFSDFEGIAKLKARSGIVADSPENWNRLWKANPALIEGGPTRPIGWVLDAGGEIVGYIGNIPLQCRYGEKKLTAVATHGFCADPPYRGVAFSLASAFYRQKSIDFFVSSSAIEVSGKMAIAFKCAALPQPDYDTVLFWVLRPYSFSRILMQKLYLKPVLQPIGSAIVAVAVGADRFIRRRRPRFTSSTLTVKGSNIDAIDEEIAELFASKLQERTRFFADRSPEVLRWHFEIPGDRGSAQLLRCYANEKLKGYAVVRSDKDPRDGVRRSVIADLIASQDDPSVVRALWVAAYDYAKAVGSDILEVQGFPSQIREVSRAWRPYRRKYPACPYYYRATDPEVHKALSDPSAWYACPFDGDATLIRPSYPSSTVLEANPVPDPAHDRAVDLAEVQSTEAF
jgi:hypothetical protein